MTVLAERPVTSGIMTEPNILDRAAVGQHIGRGVTATTVEYYQKQSKPGGLYEDNPFPDADGRFGNAPYWLPSSVAKIRAWDARRARPGIGGRPRGQV